MQRIESTFKTNGYQLPRTKMVVNLAPADIKKRGTAFDLPIALGILGASEQLKNSEALSKYVIMGELAWMGDTVHQRSIAHCHTGRKEGFKGLIIPKINAREAGMVNKLDVYGVSHIKEVITFLRKGL